MSLGRAVAIAIALFVAGNPAQAAGTYKWRDAEGKIHYSDQPPPADDKAARDNVKQMDLTNDWGEVKVPNRTPIRNSQSDGGPEMLLTKFTMNFDHTTVGRVLTGPNCDRADTVAVRKSTDDLRDKLGGDIVVTAFRKSGYHLTQADAGGGMDGLTLEADLSKMRFDVCTAHMSADGADARGYAKIGWRLKTADGTVMFRGASEGSFEGYVGKDDSAIGKAVRQAVDNLLGDPSFVDALSGVASIAPPAGLALSRIGVTLTRGDGRGQFRDRSDKLLAGTLTVQTSRGHGSGVVIDGGGYAITNAHVVGTDSSVKLLVDGKVLPAKVVRRDTGVDVALLQFDGGRLPAVGLAPSEPKLGDQLYVIGTPLDLKLDHTITKGILSAVREENGRRLYQTDAAINPGNSGGPVFDDHGDLVALSVAGLFTAQGSSLNVNFLIPISGALSALKVESK